MVAVGLLVMMYPILCKVKFETLHRVFAHRQIWVQIGFSVVMNWIVAPLVMVSGRHPVALVLEYLG
jgi:arsenite transporter